MSFNSVWFILIAVIWVGYFILEGFDFGVGILLKVVAKNQAERRAVLTTLGPLWDGNEVWLLVAGGATFAAFPEWYATLFSGFYLPLFLILISLIVRGVAFEYRSKYGKAEWRSRWDNAIVIASFIPALLWGVAFANIVRGVPLEKSAIASSTGNYQLFMTTRDKTETTTNKQTIEGFANDTTPTIPSQGQAAKFCLSGAVDKCLQNKGSSSQDCLCSHSVVNDCRKIHQTCLKSQTSNSNNCRVQFGACCGLVDSTDPNAVASMASKPNTKQGNGKQDDILCSPQQITTLDECKAACLQLDKCDFINSNIIDRTNGSGGGAGAERKGLTNDGLAPFCYLFKGEPLSTPAVMLGQKKGSGKTIYMKLRGNPDELAINAELANEKK